jgi:hypothetical protein
VDYTGISIAAIMDHFSLDTNTVTGMVTFMAHDEHGTTAMPEEVFDPANGFIAVAQNGEPLGHWEQGGRGPFMLVFAQDIFAQRFIRYLTVIEIEMPGN